MDALPASLLTSSTTVQTNGYRTNYRCEMVGRLLLVGAKTHPKSSFSKKNLDLDKRFFGHCSLVFGMSRSPTTTPNGRFFNLEKSTD
jgi:hypothetical protein